MPPPQHHKKGRIGRLATPPHRPTRNVNEQRRITTARSKQAKKKEIIHSLVTKKIVKPKRKIVHKFEDKKKTKKVITGKTYKSKEWITITFLSEPIHAFFPSNIFPEAIHSQRMNYGEAQGKPDDFWKDKKIVFHMADRNRTQWLPFYKRVIDLAKICWIKYAAKIFMTYPIELDRRRYNTPMSFYRILDDACDNVLWELPLDYGGFWNDKNKVPLTLYDKKYELPIKHKKYDFLAVIDKYIGCNHILTLELMRKLSQAGYKVKVIFIQSSKNKSRKYKSNKIGINIIPNNKNAAGQVKFHDLCKQSKIMVDLSFRWTYGRVVYEALLNGAISVCTHTYGASHHLFPDLIVDTANPNIKDIYKKCVETIKRWSPELVEEYRKEARHNSSPQAFARRLNKKTNEILGE